MSLPRQIDVYPEICLYSRITSWSNEIASAQRQHQQPPNESHPGPQISSSRQPLRPTSTNPRRQSRQFNNGAEGTQQKATAAATSRKSKRNTTNKVKNTEPGPLRPASASSRASIHHPSHQHLANAPQSPVQHLLSTPPSAKKQYEPPPQALPAQAFRRPCRNIQTTQITTLQSSVASPWKRELYAPSQVLPKPSAQKQPVSTKRKRGSNMAVQDKNMQDEVSGGRVLRSTSQSLQKVQQQQRYQAAMAHRHKGLGNPQSLILQEEQEDDAEQEIIPYFNSSTRDGMATQRNGRGSRASNARATQIRNADFLLQIPYLPPNVEESRSIASLSDANVHDRRASASPSKKSDSPSKRGTKKGERALGKPKADASITTNDLASCKPAMRVMDIQLVLGLAQVKGSLPDPVKTIRIYLDDQIGYLPKLLMSHYKEICDTPNKTEDKITDRDFQNVFPSTIKQANFLEITVNNILEHARWNHRHDAHERQWGSTVVATIINAVVGADSGAKLLNLESCSIQPIDIRPRLQNDVAIPDADVQSNDASIMSAATTNSSPTTSRMVDYGLGLLLTGDEERTIYDAFGKIEDSVKSLNQSLAYCDIMPLFMDLELKKKNSSRDPVTQLAVWQGGGYLKRKLHGWDMKSMPMLGVVVNGHEWHWYVTFEIDPDELILMGPFMMGHTRTLSGVWEIMYKLDAILRWGKEQYRAWFDTQVLSKWAKGKLAVKVRGNGGGIG